jgi:hypothetical protein
VVSNPSIGFILGAFLRSTKYDDSFKIFISALSLLSSLFLSMTVTLCLINFLATYLFIAYLGITATGWLENYEEKCA